MGRGKYKKWTSLDIERLKALAGTMSATELARRLNVKRGSLYSMANFYHLKLRLPKGLTLRLRLEPGLGQELSAEADVQGIEVKELAQRIIEAVIRDHLINAVLDDK